MFKFKESIGFLTEFYTESINKFYTILRGYNYGVITIITVTEVFHKEFLYCNTLDSTFKLCITCFICATETTATYVTDDFITPSLQESSNG